MFLNYRSQGAEKFVNPATVPATKVLRIYRNDPRNNAMYIASCGMQVEIIDEDKPKDTDLTDPQIVNGEGFDPAFLQTITQQIAPTVIKDGITQNTANTVVLTAPTNLSIDSNSWQLQDAASSGDGSIRWAVSLTFDEVDGATDYEYTVNARE